MSWRVYGHGKRGAHKSSEGSRDYEIGGEKSWKHHTSNDEIDHTTSNMQVLGAAGSEHGTPAALAASHASTVMVCMSSCSYESALYSRVIQYLAW